MRPVKSSVAPVAAAVPIDSQVAPDAVDCSHQLPVYSASVNVAVVSPIFEEVSLIGSISGGSQRPALHVLVLTMAKSYFLVLSME